MQVKPPITIVLTHGRGQAFRIPATEKQKWEEALEWGLQRVAAPYFDNIPVEFAFYADLWHADSGDEAYDNKSTYGKLISIETALALNMAQALGLPSEDYGESWGRDILSEVIRLLDARLAVGQLVLRLLVRDVAQYLSDADLREKAMARLTNTIRQVGGSVLLLAHSMGTIVGYDVLMHNPGLPVEAFITFGSPLGLPTIRRYVADANGATPFPPGLPRWINVYDENDFVAIVPNLSSFYCCDDERRVEDIKSIGQLPNLNKLTAPHDPLVYLSSTTMGRAIRSVLDHRI